MYRVVGELPNTQAVRTQSKWPGKYLASKPFLGICQINESRESYDIYLFLAQRTFPAPMSTAPAVVAQIYSVPSNKTDPVPRTLRYSHSGTGTATYGRIFLLADVTACELYSASILSLPEHCSFHRTSRRRLAFNTIKVQCSYRG